MGLPVKIADIAPRVATGAFILNSGLSKRTVDEGTAKGLHGMASGAYPVLGRLEPQQFAKLLSAGEITLGAALLAPVVPTAVAGAALTAFAAGLVGLYLRTPGLRKEGSLAPTHEGIGLAKDVWMLGIGVGFVADAIARRRGR
ncbi:MAG TPA: hypothetical protein VFR35_10490 [Actinoplanes sp.]|nr:hypothetical protein [Actinoplanes sp.]